MTSQEALPSIDIAVAIPPRSFVDAMAELGELSGRFLIERHYDFLGEIGFHGINFRPLSTSSSEVGAQLIVRPERQDRVFVELRGWSFGAPTRDENCSSAKELIGSLLQAYNRQHRTRYRMRIAGKAKAFVLPAASQRLFSRFCLLANKSSLHVLDWRRFYEFARYNRAKIPEGTLRLLLMREGFSDEKAERIADIYEHLRAFKKHR